MTGAAVIGVLVVLWLAALPLWTLLFYWALMHVDKAEHEGWASPQALHIARRYLLPVGALNNLVCAWTWGVIHYRTFPGAVGVTKLTNRMVDQGNERQAEKALRIRRLYLNKYDHRGEHK